jgi:protocatechuate 4,5-dioxygenase, alpha chain
VSGYWLNRAFNDLQDPLSRDAYRADREAYLERYPLEDAEKQLVRDQDWAGTVAAGASVYTLTKLGATIDVSLLQMGAQMRGETFEEFLAFVNRQNGEVAQFALLPGTDDEPSDG